VRGCESGDDPLSFKRRLDPGQTIQCRPISDDALEIQIRDAATPWAGGGQYHRGCARNPDNIMFSQPMSHAFAVVVLVQEYSKKGDATEICTNRLGISIESSGKATNRHRSMTVYWRRRSAAHRDCLGRPVSTIRPGREVGGIRVLL
jgi:hypothetical protein